MYILSILVIIYITNWHITNIVIYTSYIYIYIYIHRHMFCPSQDLSVWLGLMSREQLMSPECSKHQVLSFAKMLVVWWTNKKYSVLISVLQSAQWVNSERIYPYTHVSSFPGLTYISYIYIINDFLYFCIRLSALLNHHHQLVICLDDD